jgi:hypothetical protein
VRTVALVPAPPGQNIVAGADSFSWGRRRKKIFFPPLDRFFQVAKLTVNLPRQCEQLPWLLPHQGKRLSPGQILFLGHHRTAME